MSVWSGVVTRVDGLEVFVEIPAVAEGFEFGPCRVLIPAPTAGERVMVAPVGTGADEWAIVGALSPAPISASIQAALDLKADAVDLAGKQDISEKGAAGGYASLDGGGKVPAGQLPSSVFTYEGVWNAATNTPALADGAGDAGQLYRVTVAGTRNLGSGAIEFAVGDYVIYNSSGVWEKSDTTDAVASVAGKTGVVVLVKGDVGLGNVDNTSDANKPVSTAQQAALDAKAPLRLSVPAAITAASYTVQLADEAVCLQFNSGSPQSCVLPADATVPVVNGSLYYLRQIGLGLLSVVADTGVTIRNPFTTLNSRARYATIIAHKTAANLWTIVDGLS